MIERTFLRGWRDDAAAMAARIDARAVAFDVPDPQVPPAVQAALDALRSPECQRIRECEG